MTQIKILNLDNACSLSELNYEDINIVRGGYASVLGTTKNLLLAYDVYNTLARTGNIWLASAASLST